MTTKPKRTRTKKPQTPLQLVNALARELRALGYQVEVGEGTTPYTPALELQAWKPRIERESGALA